MSEKEIKEQSEQQQQQEKPEQKEQVQEQQKQESNKPEEKPILIVDANAFIKCLDLTNLSTKYKIVSSYNVISEIRDKKAIDKFLSLPFSIEEGYCSEKSVNFVKSFAQKTGDFASLSFNDMEIIAIAYEYCTQNNKLDLLRNQPPAPINLDHLKQLQQSQNQVPEDDDEDDYSDDSYSDDEEGAEGEEENGEQKQENNEEKEEQKKEQVQQSVQKKDEDDGWSVVPVKKKIEKVEEDDDFDNGKGWINPQNLDKFLQRSKQDEKDKKIGVYVMTADYAMQNVILQVGIPLMSVDNMIIRRAKRFILECFACKELCLDTTKEFCQACRNHTLLKVSCSINCDGSFVLYRKKGFKVNTRGFRYSIPKSKGGRNNTDIVLREDEMLEGEKFYKLRKQKREEEKSYKRAMIELEAGYQFGERTIKNNNKKKIQFGYGKKNPNEQYKIKNQRAK